MEKTIIDILGWIGTILFLVAYGLVSAKKVESDSVVVPGNESHRRDIFDHQHDLSACISIRGIEHCLGWHRLSHFGP